jgi:hypothetical protein
MKVIFFIILLLFLTVALSYGQVPDDFYKSGFSESSGMYEEGVKGISDIEFYYQSSYYDTPYDIRAIFPFEKVPKSTISKVTVNGKPVDQFID